MTENKADKALKKVIINLKPAGLADVPLSYNSDEIIDVDISDKLDLDKEYCFHGVTVDHDSFVESFGYVARPAFDEFKRDVENILDATIVNSKQRESIQKLLNAAFYNKKIDYIF